MSPATRGEPIAADRMRHFRDDLRWEGHDVTSRPVDKEVRGSGRASGGYFSQNPIDP